jgi:diguanylate cyclase (GGDEF)-like protein/PAS domain S-box-containing protein
MTSDWQASFQFLTENSIDIVCRAHMDTVLSYVSPSSAHVLGWLPAEMVGKRCDTFLAPEDAAAASSAFPAMGTSSPVTVRMRRKNGGLAWVEIRSRTVSDTANGKPRELVIILRDVSDRKSLLERLSALEGNDPRTGLSTARVLEESLDREWNRMVRENSQLSLLLLDFDDFRQFHSGSPHFEGDGCLGQIAAALQPILRITDSAAHYRAEQIAILLSATGASGAATVAAKVRAAVHALHRHSGHDDGNSERHASPVHIGIASTRGRNAAPHGMPRLLLLAAESALLKAIERDAAFSSGRRESSGSASLAESARLPFPR